MSVYRGGVGFIAHAFPRNSATPLGFPITHGIWIDLMANPSGMGSATRHSYRHGRIRQAFHQAFIQRHSVRHSTRLSHRPWRLATPHGVGDHLWIDLTAWEITSRARHKGTRHAYWISRAYG